MTNERRLTPEGVDLARSDAVDASAFLPPWTSLPAGVWADEIKPFVPSRYAVCYSRRSGQANGAVNGGYEDPSTVLRFFPAQARAILGGKDHSYERSVGVLTPGLVDCSEVTIDEARALVDILSDVRVEDSEGRRAHLGDPRGPPPRRVGPARRMSAERPDPRGGQDPSPASPQLIAHS